MTRNSASELEAAKRVLALALANARAEGAAEPNAAVRGYELLRSRFEPVIGTEGVRALVARSVRLAAPDVECLKQIGQHAAYRRTLAQTEEELLECFRQLGPASAPDVAAPVFATFLELMSRFVGEGLVRHLLLTAGVGVDRDTDDDKETAQ